MLTFWYTDNIIHTALGGLGYYVISGNNDDVAVVTGAVCGVTTSSVNVNKRHGSVHTCCGAPTPQNNYRAVIHSYKAVTFCEACCVIMKLWDWPVAKQNAG